MEQKCMNCKHQHIWCENEYLYNTCKWASHENAFGTCEHWEEQPEMNDTANAYDKAIGRV